MFPDFFYLSPRPVISANQHLTASIYEFVFDSILFVDFVDDYFSFSDSFGYAIGIGPSEILIAFCLILLLQF